jgi:C-terminal processing protease CtpA/Prc
MTQNNNSNNAREQLLDLLESRAFQPVLEASPENYENGWHKEKLQKVQEVARSTRQRYHQAYTSASDVVRNFRRDLMASSYQEVHEDLHNLGLPSFQDVKYEFNTLARELEIKE